MDFDGGKMEPSPEDGGEVIENPEIAQIAAEVEDTYREKAYLLIYPLEDTGSGFEPWPDREGAAILEAQGPVVAEFWQRVAEKAQEAGLPLPMVSAELAQYHQLRTLKRKEQLSGDQAAVYGHLHAR